MMNVNHVLATLTLVLSFTLFIIVFMRILKTNKWSLAHLLDVVMAMGYGGLVILVLSTKNYQADTPMIIILGVLIIKYLCGWRQYRNEVRL